MPADQAEVVGEYMAVKFVAELSTQRTAASATYKPAENSARNRSEGNSERTCNSSNGGARLTASNCCTDAACCTADRTDGCRNFHCLVERRDFG